MDFVVASALTATMTAASSFLLFAEFGLLGVCV
jgi:hypothetical protein